MEQKTFNRVVAGVFYALAGLQTLRLARGWEAEVAGRRVPMWPSAVIAAFAGLLATRAMAFNCASHKTEIGGKAGGHRLVSSGSYGPRAKLQE